MHLMQVRFLMIIGIFNNKKKTFSCKSIFKNEVYF
jgi:hypothetical protein